MNNLKELIKKLEINLEDVVLHKADYCYISLEDINIIIEFLKQLETMKDSEGINDLEELIKQLYIDLEDVLPHKTGYRLVSVEDVDATIEFLNQLKTIKENKFRRGK